MSKKAKKYIAVLVGVAVCFCGFAFTALADTKPNYQYGRIQRAYTNDGGQGADATGNGAGYGADANGKGAGYETESNVKIMLTFNLAGGSGLHNNYVDKGTKISELKVPVRSGYDFAGWIVSGKKVSSSYEMDSDTFLTATWKKAESSSPEDGTTSDEDGEDESSSSSANAGGLVSSAASSASSAVSSASSQAPAAPAPYSMLFYLGILLVALGLGGIVMLIIRQFHNRGGRGGRGSSGGKQGGNDMTFTDISSFSDGRNSRRK